MRTYNLKVVNSFKDIHTQEKYKAGKELKNISEERAFELFSSPHHLVQFISCDGIEDIDVIKEENNALKEQIDALNKQIDDLNAQIHAPNDISDDSNKDNQDLNKKEEEKTKKTNK